MKKIEPRLLKGFRDYLPEEMLLRQKIINKIVNVFELHGFLPLETPALEHYDILSGKYGEEGEKLIYKFTDQGGRDVAMRYDLTVPLARVAGQYGNLNMPFKRYQIQPVWRADKPQKGRFREFYQCDADIIGTYEMSADAEIVSVIYHSLKVLGFNNFVIKINHRLLLNAIIQYAGLKEDALLPLCRAIDKFDKVGAEGVAAELSKRAFSSNQIKKIMSAIKSNTDDDDYKSALENIEKLLGGIEDGRKAVSDLRKIFDYLNAMGIDRKYYSFDSSLARGLDYYTGPVFETIVSEPKIGSITGGGRYDDLIGMFSSEKIPATGTSLGLERIVAVIQELKMLDITPSVTKILVINFSEALTVEAMKIVGMLRSSSLPAEIYYEPSKISKQLRYADRNGIPVVIIPGEEELSKGEVVVKKLKEGTQENVSLDNLLDNLHAYFNSRSE